MAGLGLRCRDVRTREVGVQDINHKVRGGSFLGWGGGGRVLGFFPFFGVYSGVDKGYMGLRCKDLRLGFRGCGSFLGAEGFTGVQLGVHWGRGLGT